MKRTIFIIALITVLVTGACSGSAASSGGSVQTQCPQEAGYQCFGSVEVEGETEFLYLLASAAAPNLSQMKWVPVSTGVAQAADWTAVYAWVGGVMSTIAYLAPAVAIIFNPNIVQQLAEGDPWVRQGDTITIVRMNGMVERITVASQTDAKPVEGEQVQVRSQCQEQGVNCMNTPQPPRVALVIDDDPGWLNIIGFQLSRLGVEVIKCATFCDDPRATIFIVDGQDPHDAVVGPMFVSQLRVSHPDGFIVGISGRLDVLIEGETQLLRAQFLAAGANAVVDKGGQSIDWRSILGLP